MKKKVAENEKDTNKLKNFSFFKVACYILLAVLGVLLLGEVIYIIYLQSAINSKNKELNDIPPITESVKTPLSSYDIYEIDLSKYI